MNDEELVEVMRRKLTAMDDGMAPAWTDGQVRTLLAAVRSAGFQVFRPEEYDAEFGEPLDDPTRERIGDT